MAKQISSKAKVTGASFIAGILVYLTQTYIEEPSKELISIIPMVSAVIFIFLEWTAAFIGFHSTDELKALRTFDKQINSLEKQIRKNKKLGIEYQDLVDEMNQAALEKNEFYKTIDPNKNE